MKLKVWRPDHFTPVTSLLRRPSSYSVYLRLLSAFHTNPHPWPRGTACKWESHHRPKTTTRAIQFGELLFKFRIRLPGLGSRALIQLAKEWVVALLPRSASATRAHQTTFVSSRLNAHFFTRTFYVYSNSPFQGYPQRLLTITPANSRLSYSLTQSLKA